MNCTQKAGKEEYKLLITHTPDASDRLKAHLEKDDLVRVNLLGKLCVLICEDKLCFGRVKKAFPQGAPAYTFKP